MKAKWATLSLAFAISVAMPHSAAACDKQNYKIVLDVGHTQEEPGAISARGVLEFAFNFNLAQDIARALRDIGFAKTDLLITNDPDS